MADMEDITRVRTAVAWMRRTGRPLEEYPKFAALLTRERFDARAFATGNYPMPTRWTRRLYELARSN